MFNLEEQILEWRRQMLASGIKAPVPLEELESHLRENIEQQMKLGVEQENAFEMSIRQIGQVGVLKCEFKKNENKIMKRKLIIFAGIIVLLIGTGTILPALGKHKQRNQPALSTGTGFFSANWAPDETYGLGLGAVIIMGGAVTMIFGFKRRSA